MQIPLSNHDWRVLRAVLRGRGRPVAGVELRMDLTRKTKDGSFLVVLVDLGLLAVKNAAPDPFAAKYVLTETGRHAAEYGIHEIEWDTLKRLRSK